MNKVLYFQNLIAMLEELDTERNDSETIKEVENMEIFTKEEIKEMETMQKKAEEKRKAEKERQNKRNKKELKKRYILLILQVILYLFMILNIKGINGAFIISYILIFYILKNVYTIIKKDF